MNATLLLSITALFLFTAFHFSFWTEKYVLPVVLTKIDDLEFVQNMSRVFRKSHNSCAIQPLHFHHGLHWIWAKCQSLKIRGQLEAGVRALDLRLTWTENQIQISHRYPTVYTLPVVLGEIESFLVEYPSEFVFVFMKRDFETLSQWGFNHINDVWKVIEERKEFTHPGFFDGIRVKEIRGKMIFLPEKFLHPPLNNFDLFWSDNDNLIHVVNTWETTSLKSVRSQLREQLQSCDSRSTWTEIQLNFLLWKGVVPPFVVAALMNPWFESERISMGGTLFVGGDMIGVWSVNGIFGGLLLGLTFLFAFL